MPMYIGIDVGPTCAIDFSPVPAVGAPMQDCGGGEGEGGGGREPLPPLGPNGMTFDVGH